ncbi:MAG TPA: asparaginase [Gammaproteobacteria bacterium]|nr:asparaginase [Gammaproteobacteria bacterium]
MTKQKKSVCILSTGGTISMQKTMQGYAPAPGFLKSAMQKIPELHNSDMPHYAVHEFENPIDSANMVPADWQRMAEFVQKNYAEYDGFVILHGTDTMAYTASALSFMLENLGKPVILTGSQLPLFETRNDARENLINAVLLAGSQSIPEVCIYFHNKLFRGNRTKKIDALSFTAFASPNFPELGKIGTDIHIRRELLCALPKKELMVQKFNPVFISSLKIFPGLSLEILQGFLQIPLQALILETYGVGTAPEDKKFLDIIKQLAKKNMMIVSCSQCSHASIKMKDYAASHSLLNAGVVSGGDMTVEAVIAKLFYLWSQGISLEKIKEKMITNLRGEMSE